MKVIIIANYTTLEGEKGSCRLSYLAKMFATKGHQVTLITSTFSHRQKQQRDEEFLQQQTKAAYELEFVYEPGYKNHIGIQRILSHTTFGKNLKKKLDGLSEDPDLIYFSFPTFSAAEEAVRFAKQRQVPAVLDIIDIWPEALMSVIRVPKGVFDLVFKFYAAKANAIYKNSDALVGVSETYVNRAKKVAPDQPGLPVYLGADLKHFDSCTYIPLKSKEELWLIYIGTLSYSYDIKTLIRAMDIVCNKKKIKNLKVKILGAGPQTDMLIKLSESLRVPVDFVGFVEYEKMVNYLKNADIAVNAIVEGAQQSITYKIGDFVSAGLPILNGSQNPEFQKIVSKEKLGLNYRAGDQNDLSEKIIELVHDQEKRTVYGQNSRKFAEKKFDRRQTYEEIINLAEILHTS